MHDFNVIAKGKYTHKQTNEFLHVLRFLIVRKKKGRVLLLNLDNRSEEKLTGLRLQIDQFDVRGKSLGFTTVELGDLAVERGEYVLKKEISVHRACIDFRVQVLVAEYGNFAYRLGDNDTYITYEKPQVKPAVDRAKLRKKLGDRNFRMKERRMTIPVFVSAFLALLLCGAAGFYAVYAHTYKQDSYGSYDKQTFHRSNVLYGFTSPNFNENTPVEVIGYTGLGGSDIEIPSKIDGHTVQSVKEGAFAGNLLLESVTIGSGVRVETRAFADCFGLRSVTLQGEGYVGDEAFVGCVLLESFTAQNLSEIGESAFSGCHALNSFRITDAGENGTLSIGENAFYGCRDFDEIYINRLIQYGGTAAQFPSVNRVGNLYLRNYNYASGEETVANDLPLNALFGGKEVGIKTLRIGYTDGIPANFLQGCEKDITSVRIDNLRSGAIGASAFADCEDLSEVSLPVAITEIGERAFAETAITSFNAKSLKKLGAAAFVNCDRLESCDLGENSVLTNIPADAFNGCSALKAIAIPKAVTNIGSGAFSGCKNAETLTFAAGSKLENIMPDAFADCRKVRSVALPSSVRNVRENAFEDCRSLRLLHIPAGEHEISDKAFTNCYKLYEIENYGNGKVDVGYGIAKYAFAVYTSAADTRIAKPVLNGFVFAEKGGEWYAIDYEGKGGDVALPSGVNGRTYKLLSHLFGENETVTGVTVPSEATTFGSELFLDSKVKKVVIGDGYQELEFQSDTFKDSESLEEVHIRRNFGELSESTFAGCENLKTVSLPSGISAIPKETFYGCTELETVSATGSIRTIADGAFYGCSKLEEIFDATTVLSVGRRAFYQCSSLPEFRLGIGLQSVGEEAFYGCASLTSVTVYANELGSGIFAECRGLKTVKFYTAATELGESTFENCVRLTDVALSGTIESIRDRAFFGCSSLRTIEIPSATISIGNEAFRGCTALLSVHGGAQVQALGEKAFYNCKALETALTFTSLVGIGAEAFRGCGSLQRFYYSSNLETMGEKAFYDCFSLTEVSLLEYAPIEYIPEGAYKNCTALEAVTISQSIREIANDAFENTPKLYEVYDLSDFVEIERDSTLHGYLGYNALVVNTVGYASRLSVKTVGEFEFRYRGVEYFLVDYHGSENTVALAYQVNVPYEVARGAFTDCNKIEKLTIGSLVSNIRSGGFTGLSSLRELYLEGLSSLVVPSDAFLGCERLEKVMIAAGLGGMEPNAIEVFNEYTVYYGGDADSWDPYLYNQEGPVYYYDVCRHHDDEWNYENGEITIGAREYSYRETVPATCTQLGQGLYYCDTCGYEEYAAIWPQGHSYNTHNECTQCGNVNGLHITAETLNTAKKLLTFEERSDGYFDLFGNSNASITLKMTKQSQTAVMEITAKASVLLSFYCVNNDSGTLTVSKDGQTLGMNTQRVDLTLDKGSTLLISYQMWENGEAPNVEITDMYISSANEY